MCLDDRDYLERRAEEELDCANSAAHPAAMRAHYELLGYYLNQLYPGEDEPDPMAAILDLRAG